MLFGCFWWQRVFYVIVLILDSEVHSTTQWGGAFCLGNGYCFNFPLIDIHCFWRIISDKLLVFLHRILRIVTAITTVVTIAEILKNNGLATEKSNSVSSSLTLISVGNIKWWWLLIFVWFCYEIEVLTSTVGMKDENKGRLVQKAKVSSFVNSYQIFSFWHQIALYRDRLR